MKRLILSLVLVTFNLLRADCEKELSFIAQFVKPGNFVFDVGAHKGSKTDLYLLLNAKVLCIEPQPNCVEILKEKYSSNSNIQILNSGLSDSEGKLQLHICSIAPTISTFSNEWQHGRFIDYSWDSTIEVSMTTLDKVIQEFGLPDFCKIDVEGFEYEVLKGLSQPIPCLSFEFTKEFFKNSKLCIEYLKNLGYSFFNYAIGENLEMVHKEWISAEELIEEIANNPDKLLWGDIYTLDSLDLK